MKPFLRIIKFAKNFLAQLAIISLILEQFIFVSTAAAQTLPITPDGSTNTQVTQTASGVDQINIAAPGANGTSHNKFENYNVNAGGQVINNFSGKNSAEIAAGSGATAVTQTQIGGLVTANSNLASSGSAKVILNEVTSGNTSQLLGYTEIAGTKADFILANPNGIACHGCGFINTARLLMVAGSSNFDANGNLGFNLKEQANPNLYVPLITIDGLGLDITRTSGTEIVASSVKLLSSIFGSDSNSLGIRTGEGRYDYATKTITGNNTQNNTDPVFAIDASALAQIQAGQVYIIATKQGVGVKMESEILASQTLNLDANGDIYYKSISVGDTATLRSSGTIQTTDSNSSISAPTINITANQFNNSGLASAYNLNIQNSGTLNNSGNLEALNLNLSNITNINNSGSIFGQNSLAISGANLTNNSSGSIYSPVDYTIALTGLLTNSGLITSANNLALNSNQFSNSGEVSAQNNLTFSVTNSANNSGNLIAGNALNFSADSFTNSGATQSDGSSTFNLSSLSNQKSGAVYSGDSLNLNVETTLKNSGQISATNDLTITGNSTISNYSKILANGNLTISANSLRSGSYGMVSLLDGISIDINSPDFGSNSDAVISSLTKSLNLSLNANLQNFGELSSSDALTISSPNFANFGNIIGSKNLNLSASFNLFNSGNIQSSEDTTINTASLYNSGLINSLQSATINADEISNQADGVISTTNDLALTSTSLSNLGLISSGNNFTTNSSSLTNSGSIYSANNFSITNSADLTNSGTFYSDGSLAILSNSITNNSSAWIYGSKDISLTSNLDLTNAGNIQATTDLTLLVGRNANNSGTIVGNQLTFTNSGSLANSGSLGSENDIILSATNFTNSGLLQSLRDTQINLSGSFDNQDGSTIYSGRNFSSTSSSSFSNSGEISSVNSATISASSLTNQGTLLANSNLTINATSITNSEEATLASINQALTINISDYLENSGTIFAKTNFTLANLTNGTQLNSVTNDGDISFNSLVGGLLVKNFSNSGNFVSGQDLTITSSNSFNNSGTLNSSNNLNLNTTSLTNSGEISANQELTITSSGDLTNSGNILSNAASAISANNLTNNLSSAIASLSDSATLTITNSLTNNGQISSNDELGINSKNLTNAGDILSNNKLTITAQNSVSNSGNLQSASDFSLTSASLTNSNAIKSFGKGSITSASITNQDDGLIYSDYNLTLISSSSFTNSGAVLSGSKINLTSALANNSGEVFASDDLALNLTNTLTNSGSLSSLGNLNISSNSNINNTNQILSNGTLSITAANLSSSNLIQSNDDLSLNLVSLSNTNNIVSGGAVNISASGSVSNSGILESAESFNINASSFSNTGSSLILAGNDLTVRASSINNQDTKPSTSTITSGIVSANGAVSLLTDTLNNNSGLVAGKSTSVSALNAGSVNLYNTLGAFISTAEINLDLGNIDYTITGTVTANNVDITANNITNQGNVTAADFIKLNATGNSGVVGSGNIINEYVGGNTSVLASLAAGTYIDFTAKNNINNYGTISATTDLSLTSTFGNINNYSTGKITGGDGTTTINALNGAFNNTNQTSVFTANNNAIFNTRDLNNTGEISVANNLITNITNNLTNNQTALIWSGNNATFNVTNTFLNDRASIYADNNLAIQKNSSLDKTTLVQNISGNIETYAGDIAIVASTLSNQRSSMKTQNYVYWQSGCNFHNHECHYDSSYTASFSGTVGANSSIDSGGNVFLTLGTLNNDSASILAVKDIAIDAPTINNTSHTFEAYQNYSSDWWGCCNPYNWLTTYKPPATLTVNDQIIGYNYYSFYGHSFHLIGYYTVGDPSTPTSYNSRNEVYSQKEVPNPAYTSESYLAYIKSGGALTITQNGSPNPTLINGDTISSYGSPSIDNPKQSRSTTLLAVDSYSLGQAGVINVDLSSITNAISNNSGSTSGSDLGLNTASTSSPTSVSSSTVHKGSVSAPTASASSVSASSETITSSSASASTSNTVFSGNFKINLDPSATTPLVESRSQFTDASKFFGSSYYFDQLGLSGSSVLADLDRQTRVNNIRMLGDSFVETKLIMDQLKTLTNDSLFLSKTTTDPNQQIKELLDNSVNQFAALGLNAEDVAIHGLTSTQANSLTKDIVTFELTTVKGVSVLAPKIYLSQDTRSRLLGSSNSLATSSTIFGKDSVTIDSPLTTMTNSGSIVSGGNLTLNVGSLTNASSAFGGLVGGVASVAKIKSGGDLTIISNNTTPNISGVTLKNSLLDSGGKISIAANNNISIANDKGFAVSSLALAPSLFSISSSSIKDDAAATRSGLAFNAASDIQISSGGSINIANNYFNTGGSIFMSATNDINNSNYTIKASDNVVMSAGNNINNIQTTANNNETRIEAGNIVSLDAGNDINNIGATIKGGNLVYLTAGHDINNKALVNYTINGSSTNSDGSAITESQALASGARYISSNLISQGNIESGGNLVMVAANDINIKGSNASSAGSSYLEATNGNINITTAALRDKTFAEGGSKKKHWVSITDNTTNIESNVTSGGTLDLVASGTTASISALASEIGNINITGSKLTSADNLTLTAKNDITIASAQDTTYSFAAGRLGRGKSYSRQSNSTTQVESELATTNNGDISITSGVGNTDTVGSANAHGSIALIASKLTTKDADSDASNNTGTGSIVLTAKEDLTISSALNTKYSESHSTKKGLTVKKSSTTIDGSTTNVSSELNAAGDITTTSGNDTNIIASNLSSQGSGSITSGGETNIFNGVDTTTHYSNIAKEQKGLLNKIPGVAPIIKAIMVVEGGYWNGLSGGNLSKGDNLYGNNKDRVDATSTTEKIVTSNLNFTNNLSINSDQDLAVRSSNLTSTAGDISLTSNLGNVSITAATANNTSNWHANNKTDRSKAKEERVNNTGVATSSEINAGKNITITSVEGDATLQAAKLTSGTENIAGDQNITVSATNGNIYLLAATNTSEVTHTDKSTGTYSFSNGTSGHINSTVINNEIRADGGNAGGTSGSVVFDTTNQIIAQYKNTGSGNDTSVFADDAKLSYLSALDPAKTIYNPVDEQAINWDQTTRGLTGVGTAVVAVAAIAATVASAGAAGVAVAGAAGATVTTVAAGVTVTSLTLGGTIIAATTAAIITTAAATAAVSATNASMNADGNFLGSLDDVGKTTLKDTTSSDALRNYAIAGITAGAAAGISEYAGIAEMSRTANVVNTADGTRTAAQVLQNVKVSLYESAISNTTSSVVQSAVSGDSPSSTLGNLALNIAIGAVGNAAAKEIGNAAHPGNGIDPLIGKPTQLALHGALGCAMGAAGGNDCASGAVSGIVGEVVADKYKDYKINDLLSSGNGVTQSDINQIIQNGSTIAELTGGLSAIITGQFTGQGDEQIANNIWSGSRIGKNAAENNALDAVYDGLVVAYDVGKIGYGYYKDDKGMVKEGFYDLTADSAAFAMPFVPAGSTKLARFLGKGEDAVQATKQGSKLSGDHPQNFLDQNYTNRQVSGDEVFYKYHGTDNRTGKEVTYVTNNKYSSEEQLRQGLAIDKDWGTIDKVTTFKPQKGTWISEGIAAPQKSISQQVYKGGDYQGAINTKNLPKSTIIRTDKLPNGF